MGCAPREYYQAELIKYGEEHFPEFDFSQIVYTGFNNKVTIYCPKHGAFQTTPSRIKGKNTKHLCRQCAIEADRIPTERVLQIIKEHHPDYVLNDFVWEGRDKSYEILCPKHGLVKVHGRTLLNGGGCWYCGKDVLRLTNEEYKARLHEIWPDYDLSLVNYTWGKEKVTVICPEHGAFQGRADQLLAYHGCPLCKVSRGELAITNWLRKHEIAYESQKKFNDLMNIRYLSYDFFITDMNLLIEFHGGQHYFPHGLFKDKEACFELQKKRDIIKQEYALVHNYKLLIIPFTEYSRIDKILERAILQKDTNIFEEFYQLHLTKLSEYAKIKQANEGG